MAYLLPTRAYLDFATRWATEDPNPTAKVDEAKRLKTLGEQGISGKLTEDFVRAVREMDELEGVVAPLAADEEDEEEAGSEAEADEPAAKRQRMIEPQPIATTSGLLSSNALQGLQYIAALKAQQGPTSTKAGSGAGLGGLADYGSDSD